MYREILEQESGEIRQKEEPSEIVFDDEAN